MLIRLGLLAKGLGRRPDDLHWVMSLLAGRSYHRGSVATAYVQIKALEGVTIKQIYSMK